MDGWIKLDRSVLESRYFSNPLDLKVWVWLMCKASTVDRYTTLRIGKGMQTVEVKRGQLIFGRNKAAGELNIDPSTLYRILQKFHSEQAIIIESNNQYSIITVVEFINSQSFVNTNEDEFEEIEQAITGNENKQRTSNEQATNKQRTSNEQATNTVEEGLEGIESSEGKELEKVEKGSTGAGGNLFGEGEPVKNVKAKKPKAPGAKIVPLEVILPWPSEGFRAAWENWRAYKKGEHGFKYKTPQSEQAALNDLVGMAEGDESRAIEIINHCMAKAWKGLWLPKNDNHGANGQINGSSQASGVGQTNGRGNGPNASPQDYFTAFDKVFGNGKQHGT
jgi:hypothetical protein